MTEGEDSSLLSCLVLLCLSFIRGSVLCLCKDCAVIVFVKTAKPMTAAVLCDCGGLIQLY